jgi:integrase
MFVKSATPPETGQAEFWDGQTPGFGLRVSQGGRKAWVLMYRHQGHLRRLTLGTYPILSVAAARDAAKANLLLVQSGKDPAFEKQEARDADSFNTLADRYLREHAQRHKKASSAYEDEKMLKRELRPAWGIRKVQDIQRRDVIELVENIAGRAPISANRVLSLASKVFNFAVSKGVIEVNPAYRITKPGREQAHDRVLSDDEIVAVWYALDHESPIISALFKVLLLSGQRRAEVLGMLWAEIDLITGWWVLPRERTKNGRLHRVPLVGQLLDILKALKAQSSSTLVFPGNNHQEKPLVSTHKALNRIIKRSEVEPFTIHDLRRTCGTGMAAARVQQIVISKVLNHITMETGGNRITLVYDRHTYDQEKREALTAWGNHIQAILGVPANQNVA